MKCVELSIAFWTWPANVFRFSSSVDDCRSSFFEFSASTAITDYTKRNLSKNTARRCLVRHNFQLIFMIFKSVGQKDVQFLFMAMKILIRVVRPTLPSVCYSSAHRLLSLLRCQSDRLGNDPTVDHEKRQTQVHAFNGSNHGIHNFLVTLVNRRSI